ncbi:tachylectin-related carbohydrate-binding protein [Micromonospora sp. NPDC002389]|uniref:tachylectin-related carbohydrate-binding protein n=1 Tax=Micromonospora sp. NPDC002389 TaxID=3154272 RepID=UPI003330259C
MSNRTEDSFRKLPDRGVKLSATIVLAIAANGLAITTASGPAQAADSFSCTGPAAFFNTTTAGKLDRRTFSTPGQSNGTWTAATSIGSGGWQNFGRVLGGPDGRVYGINSNGMHRYRWTGSTWETVNGSQSQLISSSFRSYAGTAYRDKITIDESGDFYLIDNTGALRWYRYSESSSTWTISGHVLDTGWDRYNLLVATAPGILYARATDGRLYRHRFDPSTQRWISRNQLVGDANWASFTKGLFSAGGDTVFGIQANGDLYQYRYREDPSGWALTFNRIGVGWNFSNVFTTTSTCRQGAISSPPRPSTPIQPDSAIAVIQAPAATTALGTLEFAYADNIGQLRHGRVEPDSLGSIRWSAAPGVEAYTGIPALIADAQNRVNLFAHSTTSDIATLRQTAVAMPDWEPWLGLGGAMKSEPALARLSDNSLVLFAFDASGVLWHRRIDSSGTFPQPWTSLGGLTGVTGTPVVIAGQDGAATILAVTAAGAVMSTTWRAGTLTSGWVGLGEAGFTGTPTTVVLPGRRVMVAARHSNGSVRAQLQNTDGTWPGVWTTVGDSSITPVGSPSATLSPITGRLWVFVRASDGVIHGSRQTAPGSSTWEPWLDASHGTSYVTDPTAFTWQNANGQQLGFVARNANLAVRLFWVDETAQPSAARTSRTSGETPTFHGQDISGPPDR